MLRYLRKEVSPNDLRRLSFAFAHSRNYLERRFVHSRFVGIHSKPLNKFHKNLSLLSPIEKPAEASLVAFYVPVHLISCCHVPSFSSHVSQTSWCPFSAAIPSMIVLVQMCSHVSNSNNCLADKSFRDSPTPTALLTRFEKIIIHVPGGRSSSPRCSKYSQKALIVSVRLRRVTLPPSRASCQVSRYSPVLRIAGKTS